MIGPKEKKERALGMKLFLKGDRCNSPKCAMIRRPYKPGMHGKTGRRGTLSEFGQQLLEKQRIKVSYGLREAQLRKIFEEATKTGDIGKSVLNLLEKRLDNVVFRLGVASSRIVSRQLINHGHILVNSRKVTIPSYIVRVGDVISIRPGSKDILIFKELSNNIKKYNPPEWLTLDKEKIEGRIKSLPFDVEMPFDINLVVDYYSR